YPLLVIAPIVLVGSASSHFMPSLYVLTEEGVYWRCFLNMNFKKWTEVEGMLFENDMAEIFLETKSFRNRILRSIPLYYNRNRDEVEETVRRLHKVKWDEIREQVRLKTEANTLATDAAAKKT
ncbi:MAG: hypothetical protein FWF06_05580, partial [Symbiobacteriaceae bacterium]|nr:hypothetical protein [Symbiobacteriaceae bacterium]